MAENRIPAASIARLVPPSGRARVVRIAWAAVGGRSARVARIGAGTPVEGVAVTGGSDTTRWVASNLPQRQGRQMTAGRRGRPMARSGG
jgi:hypothetical protein